jgi:hypothetical protein
MLSYKKINKQSVKPVPITVIPKDKIRGKDIFEELYCNVFICARKKSGKSSLIWKILKECVGRDTKIVIFAATVDKDSVYKHIVKHFEKKGNDVITYTSIKEDGIDNLNSILQTLRVDDGSESDEEEEKVIAPKPFKFGIEKDRPKRKRKEKLISPEIIFIFDDLSTELRSKSVDTLLKSNRHYKCKVLLSSQWMNDMLPSSLRQLDYCILFGGHDLVKLEKIHRDLDLSIKYEDFIKLYNEVTAKKYNFLYIDVLNEKYRLNLDQEIIT